MPNPHGDPPSGTRNGKPATTELGLSTEESDTRIIYMVVGGIVLAFLLGFILLVVSSMTDWVD